MTAALLRARAEIRGRLVAVLALALIVGAIGGVVIFAAAGARRTETAYPRLLQAEHAMDLVVDASGRDPKVLEQVLLRAERLPQVAASARVTQAQGHLEIAGRKRPGDIFAVVSPDGRFATAVNGAKILEGRMFDPQAPNEIVPSSAVANELGLRVGETVKFAPGGFFTEGPLPGSKRLAPVTMHVTGIAAIPGAFQPLAGGYIPLVLVSPGFYHAHPEYIDPRDVNAAIRLRHGTADFRPFRDEIEHMRQNLPPHTRFSVAFSQAQQTVGVQETTRAQAITLWVTAVLVAVAGVAIFWQALARQTFLQSIEYPTLRALGLSATQLLVVGMIRALAIGAIGGGIAAAIGFALSPLAPTGVARTAEPHPGFALDGGVVAIGAICTALVVTALRAFPAWRAARARGSALGIAEVGSPHPSAVAGALSRTVLAPSATAG